MAGIENMNIEISGVDEVLRNLRNAKDSLLKEAMKGMVAAADELMRLANKEVPLDKSTLLSSGGVDTTKLYTSFEISIGYNTPYAARLHEHPEYNFKGGRKGKYLEDPLNSNKDVLSDYIVDHMKTVLT